MTAANLEYISIENQKTDFPKHFHETFCISLINKGIEQIVFENQTLYTEAGSISITNPYEVHSNPVLDDSAILNFDTIYIPNDLMRFTLNGKNIKFTNRQITSNKVNQLFLALKEALDSEDTDLISSCFIEFVNTIQTYAQLNEKEYTGLDFDRFNQISDYIEGNIQDKFCLSQLSKLANINKFGFSKKFKASTGMSPMNYILMRKIFSSKTLIKLDTELTELAHLYNFTDLAHFSKTFKRFIGISPQKFKESVLS